MEFRKEKDSIGYIDVFVDKYWVVQIQCFFENFCIGGYIMLKEIICVFVIFKKVVVMINQEVGVLLVDKVEVIVVVCDEILVGKLDDQFLFVVWQIGFGMQFNMNVNEVVANCVYVFKGGKLIDEKKFFYFNDDVNKL